MWTIEQGIDGAEQLVQFAGLVEAHEMAAFDLCQVARKVGAEDDGRDAFQAREQVQMVIQGESIAGRDFVVEQKEVYLHLLHEIKRLLAVRGQQGVIKHFLLNGSPQKRGDAIILFNDQDAFARNLHPSTLPLRNRTRNDSCVNYPRHKYNR